MKPSELREKTVDDLVELRKKMSRQLMDSRFKNITGQLSDNSSLKKIRRDIARINTIIGEKQ